MGHLFYFIGLLVLFINIIHLSNFNTIFKVTEWVTKFKIVTKKDPIESDFNNNEFGIYSFKNISILVNFIWMFLGLLTKSWIIFIITIVFNILTEYLIKLIGEFTILSKVVGFFKLLVISSIIGILIINHFHLHLDLLSIIINR